MPRPHRPGLHQRQQHSLQRQAHQQRGRRYQHAVEDGPARHHIPPVHYWRCKTDITLQTPHRNREKLTIGFRRRKSTATTTSQPPTASPTAAPARPSRSSRTASALTAHTGTTPSTTTTTRTSTAPLSRATPRSPGTASALRTPTTARTPSTRSR